MEIVLASASPQKKSLLNKLGLTFSILPPKIELKPRKGEKPEVYIRKMALNKASKAPSQKKSAYVIAHHAVIDFNGDIIQKPKDEKEARKMLQAFSGKTHEIVGVVVIQKGKEIRYEGVQRSQVKFKKLESPVIDEYLKSNESLDHKGGYFVQGEGGMLVESIEGSYFNVVGLPLLPLIRALKKEGIEVSEEVQQTAEMQEKSIKESFPR